MLTQENKPGSNPVPPVPSLNDFGSMGPALMAQLLVDAYTFLHDLATHGTRFDLNPTRIIPSASLIRESFEKQSGSDTSHLSDEQILSISANMQSDGYLKSVDASVRERGTDALRAAIAKMQASQSKPDVANDEPLNLG